MGVWPYQKSTGFPGNHYFEFIFETTKILMDFVTIISEIDSRHG